jgi:hypothetical protein
VATSFKPPSKGLTLGDIQLIALALFGFFVLSAALVYSNLNFINPLGGGGEFYLPWVAGRAFLFENFDPYSSYVPEQVQELVYDRAARAGNEPYILDIPFHILLLYFPFSLLPDPQLARAIFTLFTELTLFTLALVSLRLTEWESPILFAILFFLFCILNFYTFRALREATPALLLGLIYAGILVALRAGSDELAGALIAVACYQWEVGGPFLLLVFLRVLYERRRRVLAGFGMLVFVLLAVAFFIYPDWIVPFLRATVNNLRADFGFSVQKVFNSIWPAFGERFAFCLRILLLIVLGYEIGSARGSDFRRFYWASCLSIAVAPLLGFRTEMENLAILILPLALVFAIMHERWRLGNILIYVILILAFVLPWAIYSLAIPSFGKIAEEFLFLFYPVLTLLGVYWIRWWAIRPPRTWFDRAKVG